MAAFSFIVDSSESGLRLDRALVGRIEGLSRARARALADDGQVLVNGRVARKSTSLEEGDEVQVLRESGPADFIPKPDHGVGLVVVKEAVNYIVVNKPAGMPSHPLWPDELGTVANALAARGSHSLGKWQREQGLVHRLDTHTSGLLLAARDDASYEAFTKLLRSGGLVKEYIALCAGQVEAPQQIALPSAHDPRNRRRMVCPTEAQREASKKAKDAVTEVIHSETRGAFSLVTARAASARRHQIRVHLASIGHPLAGDTLYAGPSLEGLKRHFLHASALFFEDPISGHQIEVHAALAADLQRALSSLGSD